MVDEPPPRQSDLFWTTGAYCASVVPRVFGSGETRRARATVTATKARGLPYTRVHARFCVCQKGSPISKSIRRVLLFTI